MLCWIRAVQQLNEQIFFFLKKLIRLNLGQDLQFISLDTWCLWLTGMTVLLQEWFFYSTDLTKRIIFLYTSVHTTKSPLPSLVLIGSLSVLSREHGKSEWKLKAHLPTEQHWDSPWIYNNFCFHIMLPALGPERLSTARVVTLTISCQDWVCPHRS